MAWRMPKKIFRNMEKKRLEMKVGLFVLVGLALMAVLMVQFSKGTSLFRGTYTLKLRASNIGGLKAKTGVLLAGVQVGTVSAVKLDPSGTNVTIRLEIYKDYAIYHDARFVIEQAGFLGDQYVSIIPTTNNPPTLKDGDVVLCQEPFNLQEVARSAAGFIQRIDETAKKLDASVADLRTHVLNAQTLAEFSTSITNMKQFTEQALDTVHDINAIVNTNGAQVGLATSNAVLFSANLVHLSDSASALLASNSVNINQATRDIADSTTILKQLATDLQAGRGLAGAILQNPELATNVQAIAANLAVTSSNLNQAGLWGILWSHEPPKPRSTNAPTPFPFPTRR
jgi:phospholipid/cholesterol/gamma-HCH transport system substrate-binding protein